MVQKIMSKLHWRNTLLISRAMGIPSQLRVLQATLSTQPIHFLEPHLMEQFTILQMYSSRLGQSKLNVHTRTDMSRQQKLVTHPAFAVNWIQPLGISGLKRVINGWASLSAVLPSTWDIYSGYPEEPSTLECLGYFFMLLYLGSTLGCWH